jgi:hypothetical protein
MSKFSSTFGLVVLLAAIAYGIVARRPAPASQTAWVEAVAAAQALQDRSLQTFRSGDVDQAIPALRAYLGYLKARAPLGAEWAPGQSPWLDEQELANERMLVAGRLAGLIEQSTDPSEAPLLWERALSYARESGRPGASIDSMREAISRSTPMAGSPDTAPGQTR